MYKGSGLGECSEDHLVHAPALTSVSRGRHGARWSNLARIKTLLLFGQVVMLHAFNPPAFGRPSFRPSCSTV